MNNIFISTNIIVELVKKNSLQNWTNFIVAQLFFSVCNITFRIFFTRNATLILRSKQKLLSLGNIKPH